MLKNTWQKSTRSNGSGACVEVRLANDAVQVADTKDVSTRQAPLTVSLSAWRAFLASVPTR